MASQLQLSLGSSVLDNLQQYLAATSAASSDINHPANNNINYQLDIVSLTTDHQVAVDYLSFRNCLSRITIDSKRQHMLACLKFAHLIQDDNFLEQLMLSVVNHWSIYQLLLAEVSDNLRDDMCYHLPFYLLPTASFESFLTSTERLNRWLSNVVDKTYSSYPTDDRSTADRSTDQSPDVGNYYLHHYSSYNKFFYTSYKGLMQGVFIRWYDRDCQQLADVSMMLNNRQHGLARTWDLAGKLVATDHFVNGKLALGISNEGNDT